MRFNYADDRVPYSMEYLGQTYYLIYDRVGSLRAVVNSNGLIIKRIDYDSFGNVILDTDPSLKVPIGFAGGLYDSDTGLVRFGVRDYDPSIGRWTAKDPIDFAGGDVNVYGYVGNNPVKWIDQWGLVSGNIHMLDPGVVETSCNLPPANIDIFHVKILNGFSIATFEYNWNFEQTGYSTDLLGISLIDLTIGENKGAEVGIGARRLSIGLNISDEGVTGISFHIGISLPPSIGYGKIPIKNKR